MAKYWINLGSWDSIIDATEDEKLREQLEKAQGAMESLSNSVAHISNLIYKTDDLEDAKEVYIEAKKALMEIFGDKSEIYSIELEITRQPECPQCGNLGRFADSFCSRCGSKLIPLENIQTD